MFLRKGKDLANFGFRNLPRVDAAYADSLLVYVQHDPRRFFAVLIEEALQHNDDELHRGVVIVEQNDFVEKRPLQFRARFLYDRPFWILRLFLFHIWKLRPNS